MNGDSVKTSLLQRWLPLGIAVAGILLSLGAWLNSITSQYEATLLAKFHPWIILALGVSLSILFGLAIYLFQLIQFHKKSFEIVNENFKKEIAERIQAEETKQKLEKALLQGQKLQAIGTLAGGIAHDFNNLLYAIIGYVGMAREDVSADSLVHKNLGKVLEASNRGQELIARILAFSRRQHHDFKPLCIKDTMEGVLSLLRPTIPASLNVTLKSFSDDCYIMGNQTQLHQVIVNIINNAVDATDGEGNVAIELSRVSANDPILRQFPKIIPTSYCKIDITDTGHGMDQTTMERIFEPFFTTKEVGKGTGLGLSTVHSIIKEHQGEVWVESQLGHGSTFSLILPEYIEQKENADGENIVS